MGTTMRNIVVATDGSEGAKRAVEVAADLAKSSSGKLFIVTVVGEISGDEMREIARAGQNIGETLEERSMQILIAAEKCAQQSGITNIQLEIGWGDPAKAIIEIAAREAADAIVLGRRGRGRLAGLLLGTVCQKIASLAFCPVIIVPELGERSPDDAPWS
jgi:nucleotide-binding universal stress UspA family protein